MITESFARYNDVRTRTLTVEGDGPPFVLLHGFSDSADTWRGVLREFERAGRAAVAVDLTGFGRADRLRPGEILPQLDALVDGVLAEHGPAVLMGNSLGACESVRAAVRNPSAVRAVVTLDEPILADHRAARYARRPKEALLFRALRVPLPVPARVVGWGVRKSLSRLAYAQGAAVDAYWSTAFPDYGRLRLLAGQARQVALETVGGYADLERLVCPLLVVHGQLDRIIPVSASVKLHRLVPGSVLEVLAHCGHCPQLDDPVGVAGLALEFVARVS